MKGAARIDMFPDSEALAQYAAEAVVGAAERACAERARFLWCLSGGRTPHALYERLATPALAQRIDWARTHVCFGDERCVAPDDAASNYRAAQQALLSHVPIPEANVHRIAGERPAQEAAVAYEATLKALLGCGPSNAPQQRFDLVLLGFGSDGHTASLFPGSHDEPGRWVSARSARPVWRITLTPLVLNAADSVYFLVSGAEKAERLAQALRGDGDATELPALRIAPAGELRWLVDRAAAGQLEGGT